MCKTLPCALVTNCAHLRDMCFFSKCIPSIPPKVALSISEDQRTLSQEKKKPHSNHVLFPATRDPFLDFRKWCIIGHWYLTWQVMDAHFARTSATVQNAGANTRPQIIKVRMMPKQVKVCQMCQEYLRKLVNSQPIYSKIFPYTLAFWYSHHALIHALIPNLPNLPTSPPSHPPTRTPPHQPHPPVS